MTEGTLTLVSTSKNRNIPLLVPTERPRTMPTVSACAIAVIIQTQSRAAWTAATSTMQKDHLRFATFHPPSGVRLRFGDDLDVVRFFSQLELDMTNMETATIKAAASGTAMEVKSKSGDVVEIDSSSLRAAIDPGYAAELEKAFLIVRGPIDQLRTSGVSLPRE